MEDKKNHGGSFNGFLAGAIVGGAVVFLLATKTGRKLLEAISEQGMEGMSGLLEEKPVKTEIEKKLTEQTIEQVPEIKKENKRRFFRKTAK